MTTAKQLRIEYDAAKAAAKANGFPMPHPPFELYVAELPKRLAIARGALKRCTTNARKAYYWKQEIEDIQDEIATYSEGN